MVTESNILEKEVSIAWRKSRYFNTLSYRNRQGSFYYRKAKAQLRLINKLERKLNEPIRSTLSLA